MKNYITPGISDDEFIRDKVPMTKEEVRAISISKLHLKSDSVIYDVGAGTGSVSIECALLSEQIQVYAIETNPTAVELIKRNVEKFDCGNVEVIEALAPAGFVKLPAPTHAFIGGSKGNLKEILSELRSKNNKMRVVMNAVSLESVCEMQALLAEYERLELIKDAEILQVAVSKANQLGSYHLMQANNPVFVFAFSFC